MLPVVISLSKAAYPNWVLGVLVCLLTAFALWGAAGVPFHPDESTQLYMSSDFETLLRDPFSMGWTPEQIGDLRAHYRLVDAPLTKYLLGLGRSLAGMPALPTDWDWSKSWQANQAAGAVPDPQLLLAGRVMLIGLLPFSLSLIFKIGQRIRGNATGLLAALLLGINALVLLHDRRAMAEAALTFGVLFVLWSFLDGNRRPWLVGLSLAWAFNAKQTALALLPIGLLAVAWPAPGNPSNLTPARRRLAWVWVQSLGVFFLVTGALNPFLWRQPLQAIQVAFTERQVLLQGQVADHKRLAPEVALDSSSRRIAALLANLYFAPPAFAEAGNYLQQTADAEQAYMANPGHNLLRGLVGGGITFALNLAGIALACLRLRYVTSLERQALILILVASLCLTLSLFWLAPLPWQRYVMPLVPLSCIWSAYALSAFGKKST